MILKHADDKTPRLHLLQQIENAASANPSQKKWAREESYRLKKGIQGEKDSAFFLGHHFTGGKNHVMLHDLRIVVDGQVAQIDHVLLNRVGDAFLIETKNYGANIEINEHEEFTAVYDRERFGIPSPLEQSRRHVQILKRLLERLDIKQRTGAALSCHSVVMYHPKAIIKRPKASALDTSAVIKADQFGTWHGKFVDSMGGFALVAGLANMRSVETIEAWGQALLKQHRPANQLEVPDFIKPLVQPATAPAQPAATVVVPTAMTVAAVPAEPRIPVVAATDPTPVGQPANVEPGSAPTEAPPAKKLICLTCQGKITFPEGRFCWSNPARFGGGQYCRDHQAQFPPA